jgi:hypothetical protein
MSPGLKVSEGLAGLDAEPAADLGRNCHLALAADLRNLRHAVITVKM